MNVKLHNCRCSICFKKFEIARPIDQSTRGCYFDSNHNFRYYEYKNNGLAEKLISQYIASNFDEQVENDNTRGFRARELLGKLADGEFKPIGGYINCPRCNTSFHSTSNAESRKVSLELLTFNTLKNKSEEDALKSLSIK